MARRVLEISVWLTIISIFALCLLARYKNPETEDASEVVGDADEALFLNLKGRAGEPERKAPRLDVTEDASELRPDADEAPFLKGRTGEAPRLDATPESEVLTLEEADDIASMVDQVLHHTDSTSDDPRAGFEQVVALSTLLPKISTISRIKTPSPETFRNYVAPVGLPVIFTDMFDGTLLRQWTWNYVRNKWGDHVFSNTRQGDYSTQKTKNGKYFVNRVSVTLRDFIDVVLGKREPTEKEKGLYITKQRVIPREALEKEFYYPPFYPGPHKNCYLEPTGWIGSPGTFTQGHIDSKDNFVYQVIGRKHWVIFPPTDHKYLYYTQNKGRLEWSSALNSLTEPDLEKFPLYSKTTPMAFTMNPGEVLYLPRGWTHTVQNVSPALMINTWRRGPAAITEPWSEKNRKEIQDFCF